MTDIIGYMEETWREDFTTSINKQWVVVTRSGQIPDEIWARFVAAVEEFDAAYEAVCDALPQRVGSK